MSLLVVQLLAALTLYVGLLLAALAFALALVLCLVLGIVRLRLLLYGDRFLGNCCLGGNSFLGDLLFNRLIFVPILAEELCDLHAQSCNCQTQGQEQSYDPRDEARQEVHSDLAVDIEQIDQL